MTHIDDWLDDERNAQQHPEAHLFFEKFRRPAMQKIEEPFDGKLFCTWEGKRWRVIGCSRMGDVWLTADFSRASGYNHRVDVMECSDWSTERPK